MGVWKHLQGACPRRNYVASQQNQMGRMRRKKTRRVALTIDATSSKCQKDDQQQQSAKDKQVAPKEMNPPQDPVYLVNSGVKAGPVCARVQLRRETFDFLAMGRIFAGLYQVGAWGCFDEFNRLEERMLSAVSQPIQTIQEAPKSSTDMAIFITMNPGRWSFRPTAQSQESVPLARVAE
ncbi:conserved hypothetical protein [Culex quinquefasciatus]|uniref:Dynein heavy chain hydrolytic ATP-binding dynein motor region domain-containing protein n=1 Tax=Culex quinquefasciatus TaxID=7176 RepID=B0W0Y9_CULQU|nr:conserved hypothetical protein [Culex quinquefasciatus]|eukprot:XP_001842373.1 conserved hypothetical protein [Culex quinquefasciatus]